MYMLTVTMLSGAQLGFQWKDQLLGVGTAQAVQNALEEEMEFVKFGDEFGRKASLRVSEIAAWLGGDFADSLVGNVDASIIQARAQADAAAKAASDPKLRFAQQMAVPAGGGFKI